MLFAKAIRDAVPWESTTYVLRTTPVSEYALSLCWTRLAKNSESNVVINGTFAEYAMLYYALSNANGRV